MPNCAHNDHDAATKQVLLRILIPTPAHSAIGSILTWQHTKPLPLGTLVRVPLGKRVILGLVWFDDANGTPVPPHIEIKPIQAVLDSVAPLDHAWCNLVDFAARYYQRSIGEVALSALPPALRELDQLQLERFLVKLSKTEAARKTTPPVLETAAQEHTPPLPELSPEQADVVSVLTQSLKQSKPLPTLLFGATGSGKTEVYMRLTQLVLESAAARGEPAQVLVMVPEINLTPQLEARFLQRFCGYAVATSDSICASQGYTQPEHPHSSTTSSKLGKVGLCTMHSAMTPAQRLRAWFLAHHGQAQIILGTRMAVFACLPHLRLIIVDEEHDPSYKSQDGARYSARDLAIWRAHHAAIPVLLGSATPSLESWHAAQSGRYQLLRMGSRFGQNASATLPPVRLVNTQLLARGLSAKRPILNPALKEAISKRVARGEQSLLFLNRRGYAPVLVCDACGWKSACPHCSAYRVFHKRDRTLRCHHCGYSSAVHIACPECGNLDIDSLGRGTERIEEEVALELHSVCRPDGTAVRLLRMDADTTKHKGALEQQLAQVHAGDIDIIIGTQMVTKGHDFRRITLVAALNPDAALFSTDFRAAERQFSLLLQAAGRAGRDAQMAAHSEVYIQTSVPEHPLFHCLMRYDFERFAQQQLQERKAASMPPFSYQALVRAEARSQEAAQGFLSAAREAALAPDAPEQHAKGIELVQLYAPVPMNLARLANIERAQMLIEAPSRAALQNFLAVWQATLHRLKSNQIIRWAIDVDPLYL